MDKSGPRYLKCIHCNPPKQFATLTLLDKHWYLMHDDLSSYSCGQCREACVHRRSLVRHIKHKHVGHVDVQPRRQPARVSGPSASSAASSSAHAQPPADDSDDNVSTTDDPVLEIESGSCDQPDYNLKEEAAKFLISLRSSGNITGASVSLIQEYVGGLVENLVKDLRNKTVKFLQESNASPGDLEKFLTDAFEVPSPFVGLETTDKQLDYFHVHYGLPIPSDKYLDNRIENRLDRKLKMVLPTQVPESFQSVSLIEILSMIIRNPYLRRLILDEKQSDDGVYRSYKDGTDFKTNTFLQKYPTAVRIVLNYDDLEVTNSLGTKCTIHKLGCFYILIQNLPPEEQSKISSIFLLALSYAEDLKKNDAFAKVLGPFLRDLERLNSDEGVPVELPEGGVFILRACLVNVSADALAAHALLGLLSPSASLFCRLCMITKKELREDSTAIGQIRSSWRHERHVQEVERNIASTKKYGVKERSALHLAMRVPEDCVFDAFHDLVGVTQMVLKLALYEFILVRKLFTVFEFNSRVRSFVYGKPDMRNKPSVNFSVKGLCGKGHILKQYGSQTFCLLRVFPFLISGVQEDDKYLQLVLLLQDIVKIIFSFELRASDIDRLEILTYQHNKLFHDMFVSPPAIAREEEGNEEREEEEEEEQEDDDGGEEEPTVDITSGNGGDIVDDESEWEDLDEGNAEAQPVGSRRKKYVSKRLKKGINKLHHILHYPQQFREKGPLIRLWCARFEGRHRIFRKHSGVQACFKNPPKTMARMSQLSTLGPLLNRSEPPEYQFSTEGASSTLVKNCPHREALLQIGFAATDQVMIVEYAEIHGEEYGPGLFVVLKSDGESRVPTFGLVESIVIEMAGEKRIYLSVVECRNDGLSARYNAYKVSNLFDKAPVLVTLKDLANYKPIAPWVPYETQGQESNCLFLSPRTVFV